MPSRILAALLVLVFVWPAAVQDGHREQVVRLAGPGRATLLANVARPTGDARQPLVVINHGSPASGRPL